MASPAAPEQPDASAPPAGAILVAVGPDHPGVLDEVVSGVAGCGLRVEQVQTVSLGGQFAMVVRVAGGTAALASLRAGLDALAARAGIEVRLADDSGDGPVDALYTLRVTAGSAADAADASGVIRHASNLMRVLRANIADLATTHDDGTAFNAVFHVALPPDVPVAKFRELLGQMFDDLGATWDLHAGVRR